MGKPLSKTAIIAHFAKKFDMKKKTVGLIFQELANLAYKEAKNSFTFPGVGKLVLVQRKARTGRNPKTGEKVSIPEKRIPFFKVGKELRELVNG